jgi:hypothetical protein
MFKPADVKNDVEFILPFDDILPETPTPPDTIKAPVIFDVDALEPKTNN